MTPYANCRRSVTLVCMTGVMALACLLGFGFYHKPSREHQVRSQSESEMALDVSDSGANTEAAVQATVPLQRPVIAVLVPSDAPVLPPWRALAPDPALTLLGATRRVHAHRGPPVRSASV